MAEEIKTGDSEAKRADLTRCVSISLVFSGSNFAPVTIYSSQMIDVKFREGTDVNPPKETLPPDLQGAVANIRPAFTLSEDELRRIGADKLRFWFRLTLHPNVNSVQFMERLKRLESVEHAEFVHLSPLPAGN